MKAFVTIAALTVLSAGAHAFDGIHRPGMPPREIIPPAKVHQAAFADGMDRPVMPRPIIPPVKLDDEAQVQEVAAVDGAEETFMDSDAYDPNSPDIEAVLAAYDQYYAEVTGQSPYLEESLVHLTSGPCARETCPVWLHASIKTQTVAVYQAGQPIGLPNYRISSGLHVRTKRWNNHPDPTKPLRVYDSYNSSAHPGGGKYINAEGKKMGNMPYAVFYWGGFAVHGTAQGNWPKLGKPASSGCVRLHPDSAIKFNRLVRAAGQFGTWITVE